MVDEKVYTPAEINDNPFPAGEVTVLGSATNTATLGAITKPKATKDTPFPTKRIAVELLSTALNTKSKKILQEFQFAATGAIRVGEYVNGVSGDITITPGGITARDTAGNTTFGLDGEDGSAVFAGTIQAGTLISGAVAVGDSNILIDGATKRMIFYDDDDIPQIVIGLIA